MGHLGVRQLGKAGQAQRFGAKLLGRRKRRLRPHRLLDGRLPMVGNGIMRLGSDAPRRKRRGELVTPSAPQHVEMRDVVRRRLGRQA
jgi:hypothetical protein